MTTLNPMHPGMESERERIARETAAMLLQNIKQQVEAEKAERPIPVKITFAGMRAKLMRWLKRHVSA